MRRRFLPAFIAILAILTVTYCSAQSPDVTYYEGRPVYDATTAMQDVATLMSARLPAITCTVTNVYDGDSLRCVEYTQAFRIAAIDAMELRGRQPYARESRDALRALLLGKVVQVERRGFDTKWKRWLVVVKLDGDDIGLAQVRAGNAWFYLQYARALTEEERGKYDEAEKTAREQGIGLWARSDPVAPWRWRKGVRR